jgi:hypothetical protein
LIECQPLHVRRVGLGLGVSADAGGDLLWRSRQTAVDVSYKARSMNSRKDLQLPQGIIGLGELLSHGMAKGGWQGSAGGGRLGMRLKIRCDVYSGRL